MGAIVGEHAVLHCTETEISGHNRAGCVDLWSRHLASHGMGIGTGNVFKIFLELPFRFLLINSTYVYYD